MESGNSPGEKPFVSPADRKQRTWQKVITPFFVIDGQIIQRNPELEEGYEALPDGAEKLSSETTNLSESGADLDPETSSE